MFTLGLPRLDLDVFVIAVTIEQMTVTRFFHDSHIRSESPQSSPKPGTEPQNQKPLQSVEAEGAEGERD